MRLGIPMRRAKPGKGRHQHHPLRGVCLRGQNAGFLRMTDDAQAIAQPLYCGAGHENRAFQRVMALALQLVSDGRQQPIARRDRCFARIQQGKTARAIGGFHHARRKAALANGRRLLIACHATNGNGSAEQSGIGFAKIPGTITHFWQNGFRDTKQAQQISIPNTAPDIEQHGARGIGGIRRMHAPTRQAPEQKTIHRTEGQRTAFRRCARTRDIVQQPSELGRGEIGISQQARAFRQQRFMALGAQLRAGICRAAILPDNGAMQAAPSGAIPKQRGFALISDANAGHIGRAAARFL